MFDFLKNLTKSDEEKQQETFSAYLDNTLSASQRQDFEALLMQDADLRAELEMAQALRQQMQEMPRRSLPRSFTLDASVYGVPKKEPLVQAYPFLRAATVLTAFFFVIALALNVFSSQGGSSIASMAQPALEAAPAMAPMPEAEIAMEEAVEEPTAAKAAEAFMATEEDMAPAEMAQEEAAQEEASANMVPPTAVVPTAVPTMAVPEAELAAPAPEASAMADAASQAVESPPPVGGAAGSVGTGPVLTETVTTEFMPTATVSSLPRPDATEEAVSRLAEPTLSAQDEAANAVEMETAVTEAAPSQTAPEPRLSLTNSQWLLIGLGLLLLFLIGITFLARRKI